jgi:hypothetical protein
MRCNRSASILFTPDHSRGQAKLQPLSQNYSHVRYSDSLDLTLPGVARGTSQDAFLAGYARRKHPDDPTLVFPSRSALVVGHGWRVPGPKPLPVYD